MAEAFANESAVRGKYSRESKACPHCGKVIKGNAALKHHINSKHPQGVQKVHKAMDGMVTESKSLTSLIRKVADWCDSKGYSELPQDFIDELRKQDTRINVAVRLIAFDRMRRMLQDSADLDFLSAHLSQRIRNDDLSKIPLKEMMIMRAEYERLLQENLEFLHAITGGEAKGEVMVVNLINAMNQFRKTVAKTGNVTPSTLPSDPAKREELRKQLALIDEGAQGIADVAK